MVRRKATVALLVGLVMGTSQTAWASFTDLATGHATFSSVTPVPVTGLVCTGSGTSVTLSWNAMPSATGYRVTGPLGTVTDVAGTSRTVAVTDPPGNYTVVARYGTWLSSAQTILVVHILALARCG